jgi:hypothetical protein
MCILWQWIVVVIDYDALLTEMLNLLPHCRLQQTPFNDYSNIVIRQMIWVDRVALACCKAPQ